MNRDDIKYVLEILEDAIENRDWELLDEAQQFLKDSLDGKNSEFADDV